MSYPVFLISDNPFTISIGIKEYRYLELKVCHCFRGVSKIYDFDEIRAKILTFLQFLCN